MLELRIYGHIKNYCYHTSHFKCGNYHFSAFVTRIRKSNPAKFALCGGDHTSNYKEYPIYNKAIFKRRNTNQSNLLISNKKNSQYPNSHVNHIILFYAFVYSDSNNMIGTSQCPAQRSLQWFSLNLLKNRRKNREQLLDINIHDIRTTR
ncbi:Nucleic-acid-binding protein [Aphis craccivora]|uniref:Nucleic-acid-binding protein n=1 Tax=Aphis craccivora TaxID=307492 RepID=A0A6G0YJI1_APHCR|nr:Nucleic-acid-binding protein [Aphis craccivora]